jgi:hypothetical protein
MCGAPMDSEPTAPGEEGRREPWNTSLSLIWRSFSYWKVC